MAAFSSRPAGMFTAMRPNRSQPRQPRSERSETCPKLRRPSTVDGCLTIRRGEWITTDFEPGVRGCFEALFQLHGAREAVLSTGGRVMPWNGREDTPHEPMRGFAAAAGLQCLSVAGGHLGGLFRDGAEGRAAAADFWGNQVAMRAVWPGEARRWAEKWRITLSLIRPTVLS